MALLRAGRRVLSTAKVQAPKVHLFKMTTSTLVRSIINGYLADDAMIANQLECNQRILSRGGEGRDIRPRGLVVCSLWEYDHSFLTAKMFERSLESLVVQSRSSGIDLDFVFVLNNGGSIDPAVREELASRIPAMITKKLPGHGVQTVVTTPPAAPLDHTVPWTINANLASSYDRLAGNQGRALLVVQPFNPLNQGKISALRDVAHFLKSQIDCNSYFADFLFQMDAETILRFRRPPYSGTTSPFGELFKFFSARNYTAVGTRDRFSIFDSDTGRPLARPVGTLQIGWEIRNSRSSIIALPGGATMAKLSSYVAGMLQLTEKLPTSIAEDYAYTKLLRHSISYLDEEFMHSVALHPDIEHLNRTPSDSRAAIRQLGTWKHLTDNVDFLLPGENFVPMGIIRASLLLVARRIREIRCYGLSSLVMLLQDVISLPAVYRVAYSSIRSATGANRMM